METQIRGLNIYYRIEGEGDAVLFLHGWGANIDLYKGLIDHLALDHCVYALDMPGVGRSDEPPEPWSVDDFTDLVEEFMGQMGIQRTVLMGHSFGGRVIFKLMSRNPRMAEYTKVVLIDAAGIKPKKTLRQKWKTRKYKIAKAVFSTRVMNYLYPDYLENMRKKVGSADYNAASGVMRGTLVKVVNEDLTGLIGNVDVPTLLIWGDQDKATPYKDALLMKETIPDAGLITLEGAGHFSYLEQPALVYSALDVFLGGET